MSACTAAASGMSLSPALSRAYCWRATADTPPCPPALPVPPAPLPSPLSDLVAQLSVLVLVSLDDGSIHQLLQLHIVQIRTDLDSERK